MLRLPAIVVFSSLIVAGAAQAQSDSGPYIGVGVGVFDYYEYDDQTGLVVDDSTPVYRLIGGYQLNENLAIEGTLARTGDIKETFPFGPPVGTVTARADYELYSVRALGLVPLRSFDFYGGVGYYKATLKSDLSAPDIGLADSAQSDGSGATLLGGVHFYLDRFIIRGEYEWFNADNNIDIWDITVGVLFRF